MKTEEYIDKLNDMYADIPADAEKEAQVLIQRLADTLTILDSCRKHLEKEGCVVTECRSGYMITKENMWSKVYDAKYRLMLSTFKSLDKLKGSKSEEPDELIKFLSSDGYD